MTDPMDIPPDLQPKRTVEVRIAIRIPTLVLATVGLLTWALLGAAAPTPSQPSPKAAAPASAVPSPRARKCPRDLPDCALGPAAEAVALTIVASSNSPTSSVFLYAEAGDGWARGRVYDVFDDHLEPRRLSKGTASAIEHLWQIPAVERRWTSVEVTVGDGQFSFALAYDEPTPPARQSVTRRADAKAAARYPDRPIRRPGKTFEPATEEEGEPADKA